MPETYRRTRSGPARRVAVDSILTLVAANGAAATSVSQVHPSAGVGSPRSRERTISSVAQRTPQAAHAPRRRGHPSAWRWSVALDSCDGSWRVPQASGQDSHHVARCVHVVAPSKRARRRTVEATAGGGVFCAMVAWTPVPRDRQARCAHAREYGAARMRRASRRITSPLARVSSRATCDMVLTGRRPAPQSPGDVRHLWEVSEDGGTSWRAVFDGRYAKHRRTGSP